MNGDSAPGSGSTPGPGSGSTSGPVPATPAEKGGPDPHASLPSGSGVTGEDIEAFEQLVALASGSPPPTAPVTADGRSLSFSWRRKYFWAAVAGGMAVAGTIVLLLFMITRPSGADTPATGAGDPAAPAQQGDAAPPAVDGAQPGAGGGAAQPVDEQPAGAAIPASCLVPEGGALDLELREVTWREEADGLSFSWRVLIHNRGSDTFNVFLHDVADANAATRADIAVPPPTDWRTDGSNLVGPDGETLSNGDALPINSSSGGGRTSVEPGLPTYCSWEYVDRLVAVYSGPECRDDLWTQLKAAPDAASREALMAPLAIDMPLPEQMKTFQCPP